MSDPEVELAAIAPNHELTITYRDRTWNLTAYALEDFGTWESVAHEQGTDGPGAPAADWGVTHPQQSPYQVLAALTEAILRRTGAGEFNWDAPMADFQECHPGRDDPEESDDGEE